MAVSPEQLLISSVLRESAMPLAVEKGLDQRHFHSRLAEWIFLEDYYDRYRKTPSRLVFRQSFPDFQIKPVNDVAFFCDEVKRHFARRLLTASVKDVADYITDGKIDMAIEKMRESVVMVATETMPGADGDIFQQFEDVLKEVEERKNRYELNGSSGITTGLDVVDEYTGGLGPNEHWIVAARQGAGKSWFLQRMATSAALAGYNVYFAALEQNRAQVSMRIYAMMSAMLGQKIFSSEALMRGRGYEMKEFKEFLRYIRREQHKQNYGQLVIGDATQNRITPLSISAQIDRFSPELVFIDYIQLMNQNSHLGPAALASVVEDVTKISNEKAIPVVSASQLNREAVYQKEAGTENLSGSDQLGRDATVVLTLKQMSPSVVHLKNVKNRYGISGWSTHLEFRPDAGICKQITEERALDLIDNDEYEKRTKMKTITKEIKPTEEKSRARKLRMMKKEN